MQDFSNFSKDKICELFSHRRISSYDNINQHFENFALIGSIAENLGIAEVLLRNKIDSVMSGIDLAWLDNLPNDIELETPKEPNLARDKIISIQSLGFWVRVAERYKIESKLFEKAFLDNLDFKRYYVRNVNDFKNGSKVRYYQKANLLLHLLRNLRNRAFHFENLYKLNNYNKPRLSARFNNPKIVINLETAKIQVFLNDLIDELLK
ncbi:hypothetical protein [Helicobacter sp. T3_23-1059]